MGRFTGLKAIVEGEPRAEPAAAEPVKPKRIGKRDHPDYTQISVYIRKNPYYEVKRKLIGSDQDFSDLVNHLIEDWLKR